MKEFNYLSADSDPELYRIVCNHQKMLKTGKSVYFEDYELVDLANFYYENGEMEDLEQTIKLADQIHPDNSEILDIKARLFLRQGKTEKTIECIEKMKKIDATLTFEEKNEDASYWNEMRTNLKMLEGETALIQNSPEKAEELFQDAFDTAEKDEDKSYVAINIASIYLTQDMNEQSIKWVERSIELIPNNQPALELLSYYYSSQKDIKKAEKVLEKLVDEDPYSTHYWKLTGDAYLNNNQFEKAIDAYDFVLAIDVNDYEALKKKAIAFLNLENFEKAYELFINYQKMVPDDYNAQAFSALCLSSMQQYPEAIDVLENIMKETNNGVNDNTVNQAELFSVITRTCRRGKEFDKAMKWIDKALEYELDNTFFTIMKGAIYMDTGRNHEAAAYFHQAIENTDDRTLALYLVGNEFFLNKNYLTSNKLLLKVYEEDDWEDDFPVLPAMLAYGYLCVEEYENYLKFLKEACDKYPEETELIFSILIPENMSLDHFYLSEKNKYE